jgi:septal ring factor EnvC (AmiA/AmiB activator)
LVKLADSVRRAKALKDKDALQKAEQLLVLGMAVLSGRHDFDPLTALSQVYAQLTRNRQTSGRPPDAVVRNAVCSASVKNLETFGAFNVVLSKGLEEARKELSRARDDLAVERDRVRRLQEKIAEGEQVIASLQAEKMELAEKLNSAGTQLKGVEGGRDDELNTLRARFRQLLKGKLSPFVSNAQEALGLDPPVITVAQDRLGRIKNEIEGELDWLNRFLA